MHFEITNLTHDEIEHLEELLEKYDFNFKGYKAIDDIDIGIKVDGKLVAGISGRITEYKILYVDTHFVAAEYRNKGLGKKLLLALEDEAHKRGVGTIRLDTFNWQGPKFYQKLGYKLVGQYENKEEGFAELFFVKDLTAGGKAIKAKIK
ncbi:MAG: GNAT family N-acetyltransferase [Spirochaetaceae bacterium]|nr:GNAT family N-acetyltransferase [Spirochaetaceae bacterium]